MVAKFSEVQRARTIRNSEYSVLPPLRPECRCYRDPPSQAHGWSLPARLRPFVIISILECHSRSPRACRCAGCPAVFHYDCASVPTVPWPVNRNLEEIPTIVSNSLRACRWRTQYQAQAAGPRLGPTQMTGGVTPSRAAERQFMPELLTQC